MTFFDHPVSYSTLILFTLTATLLCAELILNEFELRKFLYFCKSDVSAVQGHARSLTLVPIESAYATSYWSVIVVSLVLSCTVSEILQDFCAPNPTPIPPYFGVFPLDQIADVGVSVSRYILCYSAVKLFSKYSNLCDHGT